MPTLVLGALLGRVVGEVVAEIFPDKNILKAGYAVVGAAACTAGVTQAMSTAVILIEATSDSSLTIPIVVCPPCSHVRGESSYLCMTLCVCACVYILLYFVCVCLCVFVRLWGHS